MLYNAPFCWHTNYGLLYNPLVFKRIEQKGMTFDLDFCSSFSFSSFLFFKEGRDNRKRITKVVVKSHAFLLDHLEELRGANYFLLVNCSLRWWEF